MTPNFVHLHVHSSFSLLDGMSRINDLVDKAIKYKMPAVALTDHGSMYGIKELLNYVGKKKSEAKKQLKDNKITQEEFDFINNFKPIVGVEAYCAARTLYDKDKNKKMYIESRHKEIIIDISGFHLILLAKNKKGYQNLCKLASISWVDGFYHKPRIDKNILEKYKDDIIVCSACLGGEIPQLIMDNKIDEAEETINWFKSIFGDDYYLEVQLHKPKHKDISDEVYRHQQQVNKVIFELAKKTDTKVVATNDVHFVEADHAEAHERLVCLSTGRKISDTNRMRYTKQEYMKTPEEMYEIFKDHPEVLSNTIEVANKVSLYSIDSKPIMPKFDIPESFGTVEDYKTKFSVEDLIKEFSRDSEQDLTEEQISNKLAEVGGEDKLYRIKLEADYLRKLTYDGANKLYPELTKEIKERIDFELRTINVMGFPGYFLIVQDFVAAAKEMGVLVGPGRGSAAGSVVAYCLHITKIDPFKYDLLFERFLNPDRISLPDIDIDFDNDGLSLVLDWVTNKYGKNSVAHIINYGTMATKMAITDVSRVQDIPLIEVNKFKKIIPDNLDQYKDKKTGKSPKVNIHNLLTYDKDIQRMCDEKPYIAEMMKYAEQLEGTVRQTSVHACGIIIAPDDLDKFVPLSTAKDKENNNKEVLVTQYDGHVIEEIGLIKMDFLALKTLSIIKESIKNIKKTHNIDLDIENIPLDDEKTFELFSEGHTIGVFQFESGGMRKYLKELKPTSIDDLIAMNALYRPGPMDYIPDFIDRKHGRMKIQYDIPVMEKYLKDTYGITVYQEQVMLLSRQLAGFTRGESDRLRKAMGKKIKPMLLELQPKFIEGGMANGHDKKILEKIWSDWEKFASYAFNKSHSTCYAILAYQTAYLKAHYPAEFMAANLTLTKKSGKKQEEINKFMEECKAIHVPVLLPDVNESEYLFTVNKNGEIRFGLGGIKGLGQATAESIIDERTNNGHYDSIYNFLERVNLKTCNKKAMECLALSGAFDSFKEMDREDYFYSDETINDMLEWGRKTQLSKANLQNSLFADEIVCDNPLPILQKAEKWSNFKRLSLEKELIGMYLSAHPLDKYKQTILYGCSHSIAEIKRQEDEMKNLLDAIPNSDILHYDLSQQKIQFTVGGMITSSTILTSQKGNSYGKFILEDYSGQMELTLFDGYKFDEKYFSKYGEYLVKDTFVIVKGSLSAIVKKDKKDKTKIYRQVDLSVKAIDELENHVKDALKILEIRINLHTVNDSSIKRLIEIFNENNGKTALKIHVKDKENGRNLLLCKKSDQINISMETLKELEEMADEKFIDFAINNKSYQPIDSENDNDNDEDDTIDPIDIDD